MIILLVALIAPNKDEIKQVHLLEECVATDSLIWYEFYWCLNEDLEKLNPAAKEKRQKIINDLILSGYLYRLDKYTKIKIIGKDDNEKPPALEIQVLNGPYIYKKLWISKCLTLEKP